MAIRIVAPSLLVADSFRVRVNPASGAAEVRDLEQHLDRFARTATAAGGDAVIGLDDFVHESRRRIAEYGEGWPRLELWLDEDGSAPRLALQLRPLPELHDLIELRTAGRIELDHPERKGPNLGRLAELNRELGAEALLLDGDGRVVEGATTAILWWRGETLCRSAVGARVASVTERLLLGAARDTGVAAAESAAAPADLAACEVWAVNALHGIRIVTSLDGEPLPAPDASRLTRFREALDRAWGPVSALSI